MHLYCTLMERRDGSPSFQGRSRLEKDSVEFSLGPLRKVLLVTLCNDVKYAV